jgi:hypothetical protein
VYLHRHDSKEALAIWAMAGQVTGAEWDQHFTHLRDVATWSTKTGKRAACVLLAVDFAHPDAKRRRDLALLTDAPGYDPFVAFVSANAAVRAVLTVFKWVQRAPKYEMDFFPNTKEAVRWLKTQRGGQLTAIDRMVREVEAELSARLQLRPPGL